MKNHLFLLTASIILMLFGSACQNPTIDLVSAKKDIEAANQQFMTHFGNGDFTALSELYTEDAKLMPPNAPTMDGKTNIREMYKSFLVKDATELQLTTTAVYGTGDLLVEEGTVKVGPKGSKQLDNEKYIALWKKENGKWKMHRDIFNSSEPAANGSAANVATIKSVYDHFAKGDIPGLVALMDEKIVWNEAENFPYAGGNPYIGSDAILNGVFGPIGKDWDGFRTTEMEFHDMTNNKVLVTGKYKGKNKKSKRSIDAQFAHLYSLKNGKVMSFQQYADTKQVAGAMR